MENKIRVRAEVKKFNRTCKQHINDIHIKHQEEIQQENEQYNYDSECGNCEKDEDNNDEKCIKIKGAEYEKNPGDYDDDTNKKESKTDSCNQEYKKIQEKAI